MAEEKTPLTDAHPNPLRKRLCAALWLALLPAAATAAAQTCQTAGDIEAPARAAIESAAGKYFDLAARGQSGMLQQSAIPSLASAFGGVESLIKDNQSALGNAKASVRPPFLLTAEGTQPMARAEFLCGVFGSSGQTHDSAIFVLNNLPAGKYAVAIVDAAGSADALTVTFILQQMGADWKLAGLFMRAAQLNGHDAAWFTQRAREFKARGQARNAWLYFRKAIVLTTPTDLMSTQGTDKLYDEAQAVQPTDMPVDGTAVDLAANGTVFRLTSMFMVGVGGDLDLVVWYQAADIADTAKTFQANQSLIRALVAKFPELRDAFAGVAARAVDPAGQGYGSMLPMKEIK